MYFTLIEKLVRAKKDRKPMSTFHKENTDI